VTARTKCYCVLEWKPSLKKAAAENLKPEIANNHRVIQCGQRSFINLDLVIYLFRITST
jgi:hypothetical protein